MPYNCKHKTVDGYTRRSAFRKINTDGHFQQLEVGILLKLCTIFV